MDKLKRVLILFLSAVVAVAGAAAYGLFIWHDVAAQEKTLTGLHAGSALNEAALEIAVLFFVLIYYSGRGFTLLFKATTLREEIRRNGGWHLRMIAWLLVLITVERFLVLRGRGWGRVDDWLGLAIMAATMVFSVAFHLGPGAKISRLFKTGFFPGEVRTVTDAPATLEDKRARYEAVPRTVDNFIHNRLYLLRRHVGSPAERWVCEGRPSMWKLPLLAGTLVLAGVSLGALHPALAILALPGIALAGVAVKQQRSFPRNLNAEIDDLGARGTLVLAGIVKANTMLFEPGDEIAPAAVVYSLDPERRFDEEYLSGVRDRLSKLRQQDAPPPDDQRRIWNELRDDYAAGVLEVPASLAGGGRATYSHILINPLLYPEKKLPGTPIPCLADPSPRKHLAGRIVPI